MAEIKGPGVEMAVKQAMIGRMFGSMEQGDLVFQEQNNLRRAAGQQPMSAEQFIQDRLHQGKQDDPEYLNHLNKEVMDDLGLAEGILIFESGHVWVDDRANEALAQKYGLPKVPSVYNDYPF